MASATSTVARGDLTVEVRPRGERDVLGQALAQMVVSLPPRRSATGAAERVSTASEQMASTSWRRAVSSVRSRAR
jgi:hypothetical protein